MSCQYGLNHPDGLLPCASASGKAIEHATVFNVSGLRPAGDSRRLGSLRGYSFPEAAIGSAAHHRPSTRQQDQPDQHLHLPSLPLPAPRQSAGNIGAITARFNTAYAVTSLAQDTAARPSSPAAASTRGTILCCRCLPLGSIGRALTARHACLSGASPSVPRAANPTRNASFQARSTKLSTEPFSAHFQ